MECIKALALCHNVSPVKEEKWQEIWSGRGELGIGGDSADSGGENGEAILFEKDDIIFQRQGIEKRPELSYQASSPDEVRR